MATGALAVILPAAASRRGFFPLCLVLPLQGSVTFLAFVAQLEALSESLTRFIPRSFLVVALSASAVGFALALWLCPERALSRFFASVSLIDPVALSPLLHHVFADGFPSLVRISLMQWGVSPCVWFRWGPWGVAVASPILPYTGPGWSLPFCRVALELRSVFNIFPVRRSTRKHGDHFVSFPASYVSLPRIYHRVQFVGHLTRRVDGLTLCPLPRFSRFLSFALTYSHGSLILMHPAIDIVWWCPCLPRLRLL